MISRRPRRKGYSSLTSNYTADWVWGRGQKGSRFDQHNGASRQRTPYSEISAIGPPCAFLDDRYVHGRSTRNAAPSARQTWVVGQFDCGRMTGLNGSAGGGYFKKETPFVCAIDPRRTR